MEVGVELRCWDLRPISSSVRARSGNWPGPYSMGGVRPGDNKFGKMEGTSALKSALLLLLLWLKLGCSNSGLLLTLCPGEPVEGLAEL